MTSAYGRDYRLGYSLGALGGEGTTVELEGGAKMAGLDTEIAAYERMRPDLEVQHISGRRFSRKAATRKR